jgi:hypothetical protein
MNMSAPDCIRLDSNPIRIPVLKETLTDIVDGQ